MALPKLVTFGKVRRALGVSAKTLREWDKQRLLSSYTRTPGGHRLYLEKEVIKFIEKNRLFNKRK